MPRIRAEAGNYLWLEKNSMGFYRHPALNNGEWFPWYDDVIDEERDEG